MLLEINSKAQILKFSAKLGDEQFESLLLHLAVSGLKKPLEEKKNSIELSEVSAFSTLYTLTSEVFNSEKGTRLVEESLRTIQDRVREINPEFVGHVKLILKLPEFTVKGSVTSAKEPPQVEFQDRKNEKTELRLLSAITKVSKNKLTEIVESTLEERLRRSGAAFEKKACNGTNKGTNKGMITKLMVNSEKEQIRRDKYSE